MNRQSAASHRSARSARRPAEVAQTDAHPVDRHVGQQIRIRRIQSNVSQNDLARGIGVSFQQVQKYENGRNRVSASMLYQVAACLRTPVSTFFVGLPEPADGQQPLAVADVDERIAYISTAEGRQLIESVLRLSPRLRSKVATLLSTIAEENEPE
jgi:transcriptional regulator with XRE-family HTH domain